MQTAIPPTVMVINDDALQLRLTVAWIEKEGLRVLACQSAEEALRLLLRGAGSRRHCDGPAHATH